MTIAVVALLALACGGAGASGEKAADLGSIDFPTSGPAAAQEHFLRGVLWLHSFEYSDARDEFRRARELAPGFAMAAWGEAMSENHPIWNRQDVAAGRAALDGLAPDPAARRALAPTEREKGYLDAIEALYDEDLGGKPERDRAYAEAMRRLHERFPDDDEAAAFYALALLGTCEGERDFPTYMRSAAVAEEVFARNPRHPGALHYLIHAYDEPVHGPLGLRPARLYAQVAPAAPHALHMPSHIFLALGMWDDEVASNEASVAAARARGGDNLHALWWLAYGYLQQGRFADARAAMTTLAEGGAAGTPQGRRHLAYMRAAYLVDSRRWSDDGLPARPSSEGAEVALDAAAADHYAEGRRALARADFAAARDELAALAARAEAAGDRDGRNARLMERELAALVEIATGSQGDGGVTEAMVESLRAAADEEEAMSRDFGPPLPIEPVREVLAEVLLGLGRPAAARAEYERALARAPGRARPLLGLARAAAAAGDAAASREAYARLARQWHKADPDLPELAEVRPAAGAPK